MFIVFNDTYFAYFLIQQINDDHGDFGVTKDSIAININEKYVNGDGSENPIFINSGNNSTQLKQTAHKNDLPMQKISKRSTDPIKYSSPPQSTITDEPKLKRQLSNPTTLQEKQVAKEKIGKSTSSSKPVSRATRLFTNIRTSMRLSPRDRITSTFFCSICLENCAKSLEFTCVGCSFQHTYCTSCMDGYLTAQINDGVIQHACPGMGECHAVLSRDEIVQLVSSDTFAKFERFEMVKSDPNYRECPSCNSGMHHESPEQSPSITCQQCATVYCFFHANAHQGGTCEDFARRMSKRTRDELMSSEELVKSTTRHCPACNAATEKNGGCNHM